MKHLPDFRPYTYADAAAIYESRRQANLEVANIRHRLIVQNWLLHALLEISGRYEEILAPELTIAEPQYDFFMTGHPLDGHEAVQGLYRNLVVSESTAIVSDQQRYAVADWGFITEQVNHQYAPAASAAAQFGEPIPHAADYFLLHKPVVMVWNYTEDGLLIGETLYFAPRTAWGYTPIDRSQYLSTEGMASVLAPVIEACRRDYESTRRALKDSLAAAAPADTRSVAQATPL